MKINSSDHIVAVVVVAVVAAVVVVAKGYDADSVRWERGRGEVGGMGGGSANFLVRGRGSVAVASAAFTRNRLC